MSPQVLRNRRAIASVLGALMLTGATLMLAGVLGGQPTVAAANTPHHHGHPHHHNHRASASGTNSRPADVGPSETVRADETVHAAAAAAVQRLVENGTIDQHQANAIDGQIGAGSVNGPELVQSGVVSEAQMATVENALGEVKRSFAPTTAAGASPKQPPPGQTGAKPGGDEGEEGNSPKQPPPGETGAK